MHANANILGHCGKSRLLTIAFFYLVKNLTLRHFGAKSLTHDMLLLNTVLLQGDSLPIIRAYPAEVLKKQ